VLNLSAWLGSWGALPPAVRELLDAFASPAGRGRRYALGRNEHSAALAKAIELDGIVDDFAEPGALWCGKPVMKGTAVPRQAIVVNCSMCASPVSAARRLATLDIAGVLAFSDLCRGRPDRVPLPAFVRQTREDLVQNEARWRALEAALADAPSRQVLDDLLRYRTTGDYSVMQRYSVRPHEQYFEDFLGLAAGEVFVDAGGYDGDSTQEFCRRCPQYAKVYLFEPVAANLQKARARLDGLPAIEFLDLGLSDAAGALTFNADAGSASAVSGAGSSRIAVTTLDAQVTGRVSFVKMDLEGWEMPALAGSRRHILTDHPKLAIAVYHHASHFWGVLGLVMDLRTDYDVYLRHYTEGWSESVLYFVPR